MSDRTGRRLYDRGEGRDFTTEGKAHDFFLERENSISVVRRWGVAGWQLGFRHSSRNYDTKLSEKKIVIHY